MLQGIRFPRVLGVTTPGCFNSYVVVLLVTTPGCFNSYVVVLFYTLLRSFASFAHLLLPSFALISVLFSASGRVWKSAFGSEKPRSLLLSLGVPSRPSPGSDPWPVQVPSRVRRGLVQIRHVLCFTAFRTHPGPEVGAIPARPGPILVLTVPSGMGFGRAETDFLATSAFGNFRECG